jgi:hypothetical protein
MLKTFVIKRDAAYKQYTKTLKTEGFFFIFDQKYFDPNVRPCIVIPNKTTFHFPAKLKGAI